MTALILVITSLMVAAFFVAVALLLLGEVVQALGWVAAGMTTFSEPSSERKVLEGIAFRLAGLLWLSASTAVLGWIATVLLDGRGESVMWGCLALNAVIVLWWISTLRLRELRQVVRQGRGVPAAPWRWIKIQRARSIAKGLNDPDEGETNINPTVRIGPSADVDI
ncbi:hypothetical protein MycrhDRAFT_5671 [Mycolicibacterium rhodesiae JS60]|nr:hypothetical protein MycrhDRAFT_5671 [Mycolicibacterium rhodesiae JS60]